MKTIIIAAIARNGVIGRSKRRCDLRHDTPASLHCCSVCGGSGYVLCNDVPWSYPEDMKHFKDTTMGHAVVMGRNTWESLPRRYRPLPGRKNFIVSRSLRGYPADSIVCDALEGPGGAFDYACDFSEKLYVIGGAQLYAAALPIADELDLTLIDTDHEGDVKFPRGDVFYRHGLGSTVMLEGFGAFECVERHQGSTPALTFTKWVRR